MSEGSQPSIAFIDLAAQRRRLGDKIDKAVMGAVNAGAYIMGPEVKEFEKQLPEFGQAKHCLSCANGTEAIVLPLMAWGIKSVPCRSLSILTRIPITWILPISRQPSLR